MRLFVSLVLCSVLPGWGLCERLCSALANDAHSCCAEIATPSCCSDAASGQAKNSGSVSCGCVQHSAPAQEKTPVSAAPEAAALESFPLAANWLSLLTNENASGIIAVARPDSRDLLSLHQRLNL